MENEITVESVTLVDEDGKEYEFEKLDTIEEDGRTFFALLPSENTTEQSEDEDAFYYIFECVKGENEGEEDLVEIEDEELLNKLAEMFEEHFEELYAEDSEEDKEAEDEEN